MALRSGGFALGSLVGATLYALQPGAPFWFALAIQAGVLGALSWGQAFGDRLGPA